MKRSSRRSWLLYGACAAVLLLALGWITAMVLRLETAELVARAGARRQESLRLALWRMDSWLAPHLAREVARPYFDYQAFYPRQRAYTRLLAPIRPGEVLTPSPLLTHRSDLFPLHFQLGPDGVLTSPQSPEGNLRDLAEAGYLTAEQIEVCAARLAQVDALMTKRQLLESCSVVEAIPAAVPLDPTAAVATEAGPSRLKVEWQKRQQLYLENVEAVDQQLDLRAAGDSVPEVTVGTLVPIWLLANDGSDRALIFARKVTVGVEEYFQGFTCNWPVLRAALLRQVNDLFEDAQLKPIDEPVTPSLREATLATLPATLDAGMSTDRVAAGWTPFRTALGLTWLAVLAGLAAVAVTLRSSIHYGEKRSRFASAVTHELRTPLTTFRMYTEMLAEGMVDASKQSEYLNTLRNESGRLSTLVENVLCYAQLEEGRRPRRLEPVGLGVLLGRVLPSLRRAPKTRDWVSNCTSRGPIRPASTPMWTWSNRSSSTSSTTPASTRATRRIDRSASTCTRSIGHCASMCATTARGLTAAVPSPSSPHFSAALATGSSTRPASAWASPSLAALPGSFTGTWNWSTPARPAPAFV